MDADSRDRLLRFAWELPPFEHDVGLLSEIAQRIGPAHCSPSSSPTNLPYTLRNLAGAARNVSRARGGGATTLPGEVVLQCAPHALRHLARQLPQRCVLVSGTNGKTTTASMIAAILRAAGHAVTHNRAGANMPSGVATALLEQPGEIGVFEVDEAWLPIVAAELSPSVIVLGNLFRDRLDGYGELDALAGSWEAMLAGRLQAHLVLNADDAALVSLGSIDAGSDRLPISFFGVEDRSLSLPQAEHAADSIRCRACDEPLRFDARMLSHLGHHRCDSCGARRPNPTVRADGVLFDGISGSSFSIESGTERHDLQLRLPGLYNVYNALAATAAALALGVEPASISPTLAAFAPVFGRGERIRAGTTDLAVLLMKNPAGANELLRTLSRDASPSLDLLIALNDGPADGRDVSWIWDADFEALHRRVGRVICSGSRAAELALRLKYAGWPISCIAVDPEIASALDRGISEASGRLIVLPTYSALLELYTELAVRGLARPFWAQAPPLPGSDGPA
ncbi:MAG TPA: MurT ligase domain-containing protein [Solirubrobacterales bacterium]